MEEMILTPELEAMAMDRDDDLGRLFASAFAFSAPPFPLQPGTQDGGIA